MTDRKTAGATIPAAYFGAVPGLAGLGHAWRAAAQLWQVPPGVATALLAAAGLAWAALMARYLWQCLRHRAAVRAEFLHPVQGATPALLAVSTLVLAAAAVPYSRPLGWVLAAAGIGWHLAFGLWHTGLLWRGGRDMRDMVPTLYLPTVAGNLTSALALGALGCQEWGWLFFGAGLFSWLALESQVLGRLSQATAVPVPQRALVGIQFAPPVVCAMAWLAMDAAPDGLARHGVLMLWGYGLFQLLLGLRLGRWLGEQPFVPAWWAYSFGVAAATVTGMKLALAGVQPAQVLALPLFAAANLFIGYLALRTGRLVALNWSAPRRPLIHERLGSDRPSSGIK